MQVIAFLLFMWAIWFLYLPMCVISFIDLNVCVNASTHVVNYIDNLTKGCRSI